MEPDPASAPQKLGPRVAPPDTRRFKRQLGLPIHCAQFSRTSYKGNNETPTKGFVMNKPTLVAPIVIIALSGGYSAYQNYRLNKSMKAIQPLPPVGTEYLRQHEAMLSRPDVVAANETINSFLAHQQ